MTSIDRQGRIYRGERRSMDARQNGKAGRTCGAELDVRALISELALPVAVITRSNGGIRFVEISRGFELLHGLQRGESLRRPVQDLLSEEVAQPLETSARGATMSGEVLKFQADLRTGAGAARTCEYAVSAG